MKDRGDLILQFKKGSKSAFTAIYEDEYAYIFYFATRLLGDREAAADITSESFYKLWTLHENFDNIQSIKAFLQVTTRNACFNYLRDTKSRDNSRKELLYLLSQESEEDAGVFNKDELKAAFMKRVYDAITSLPKQCGRIFELSYLDGLKNNEIAETLHISEKTVRNQKVLALKLLRGLISKDMLPAVISMLILLKR